MDDVLHGQPLTVRKTATTALFNIIGAAANGNIIVTPKMRGAINVALLTLLNRVRDPHVAAQAQQPLQQQVHQLQGQQAVSLAHVNALTAQVLGRDNQIGALREQNEELQGEINDREEQIRGLEEENDAGLREGRQLPPDFSEQIDLLPDGGEEDEEQDILDSPAPIPHGNVRPASPPMVSNNPHATFYRNGANNEEPDIRHRRAHNSSSSQINQLPTRQQRPF